MGTNTFNLLIARVQNNSFEQLLSTKEGVALGMGGIHQDTIVEEAQERGLACLKKFDHYCKKWEVESLIVIGTSSIRNAKNALDFLAKVDALLNVKTRIISGKQEAELIYQGIRISYSFTTPATIIDVGGGSTEFIFANKTGIQALKSFEIGIARIIQQIGFPKKLEKTDVEKIELFLEGTAGSFLRSIHCNTLIGASGSFESLYEIIYKLPFPKAIDPIEINFQTLLTTLSTLVYSSEADREANKYIIPIRRKMMHITAVKVLWVIKTMKINRVIISPCSIKEGALFYF